MDTYNIIVVGCGGTGGNLIELLGRYFHGEKGIKHRLLLVDGDVVERNNLKRQPFIADDIGRNKAEVMSLILREVFQLESDFYPEYITHIAQLKAFLIPDQVTILIGAVDNHHCRQLLHRFFSTTPTCFYIDSANEFSHGEIVMGVRVAGKLMAPDRAVYYSEIMEESYKPVTEQSCTELNAHHPQHLATNMFAANLCFICIDSILKSEWIGGIYFFDIKKGYCKKHEVKI